MAMDVLEGAATGILFYVNGREVCVDRPDPEMTLLYFLRNNLRLTGTKLGCGEGGCGACTVMVSRYDPRSDTVGHISVNACLAPLCAMDGLAVTTVEGIGSTKTALHPCQERIARAHGSQCGFCTPGFVMSMYTLLRNMPSPTEEDVEAAFEGNLCRCTGYRAILEGYKTFVQDGKCCRGAGCGKEGQCCQEPGNSGQCCQSATKVVEKDGGTAEGHSVLFDASSFSPLDPTQEPIFPAALKLSGPAKPLALHGPRVSWYRPTSLPQLLALRERFPHHMERGKPQHRIVVGNTEIGVEVKFKSAFYEVLICPSHVPELSMMEVTGEGLLVGAAVTLDQLTAKLKELDSTLPEYKTRTFAALLEMLRWFAGQQIRNVSAVGGNIINASPISDLNPTFMASGTKLHLASQGSKRTVVMDSKFFTGYKRTLLAPNEILVSVLIPFTRENEYIYSYKQARRREDDIAIVNAGLRVLLSPSDPHWLVEECSLSYGGMSYVTVAATEAQKALVGKPWCESTLNEACDLLNKELSLPSNVPGGMPEYRQSLVTSFFFKFYLTVLSRISALPLPQELGSVPAPFHRDLAKSTQGFQRVPMGQENQDHVGRPIMHLTALQQATGEARYMDDIPHYENELYAAVVMSTHAHANITVDTSQAVGMEGVRAVVGLSDVPGSNVTGPGMDEQVFADGKVTCIGQLIAVVVATSQPLAQRAAKAVKVTYEDLPSIITIEEAIAADQFYPLVRSVKQGEDVDSALARADHVIEGQMKIGGQDHFYLETQACICIPKGEDGEMEIIASTQCLDGTQKMAALALGVPANRIVARVKRIGGGFGGKESRSFFLSTAVAVAANKLQVPVRIMLDRNEDMICSGGRHPFLAKYKVGFTSEGKVTTLDLQLFANGGNSLDLSVPVIERAILHSDNVYNYPNVRVVGRICRTNLPSNTAFRGFGGPQGMFPTEQWMGEVASYLKMSPEKVRELNFYRDGDHTPWGQVQPQCHIRRCWATLMERSRFDERRAQVDDFNKCNRWKKRGLAITPTKYGVCFGLVFMNQGGALLHVYTDGSILLTHGGMEMGQGLHTKMVQVCAKCLGIPPDRVHISETCTNTVPNAFPTAGSFSSDLYGAATKHACDQIMERLRPYMKADPDAGWNAWVKRAYYDRVNLSAQGFYYTPNLHFDWNSGRGRPYDYFSYGASCSEVEVDTLTGDFNILKSDLLMDVGNSLNPAIDIGQVEGAFTQGVGLFTLEECVYLEEGRGTQRGQLFTTGPGTYKIPSVSDIPVELNVSLMDRTPNPTAIFSSKAVGEPPFFLGASVFFAIKDAILAARAEGGLTGTFQLDSPATCERIRMACVDRFTKQVCKNFDKDAKRWTIQV